MHPDACCECPVEESKTYAPQATFSEWWEQYAALAAKMARFQSFPDSRSACGAVNRATDLLAGLTYRLIDGN